MDDQDGLLALPRSVLLALWLQGVGAGPVQRAVDAVQGQDEPHVVVGAPDVVPDGGSLDQLIGAWAGGPRQAAVEDRARRGEIRTEDEFAQALQEEIAKALRAGHSDPAVLYQATGPTIILVLGVNGAGKTTFIGKLASRLQRSGKRVLVAAGDTFRAGAIDQLRVWAQRTDAEFVGALPVAGMSVKSDAVVPVPSVRLFPAKSNAFCCTAAPDAFAPWKTTGDSAK